MCFSFATVFPTTIIILILILVQYFISGRNLIKSSFLATWQQMDKQKLWRKIKSLHL